MFNFIWASPSREFPVMDLDYDFYTKLDASGCGVSSENRNLSSHSLASEGLTAPTLMNEPTTETATSPKPAASLQPGSKRWYLRRMPDGKFHVEAVMKDYRQELEGLGDDLWDGHVCGGYRVWNRDPMYTGAATIKHQGLSPSDGTLSCDPLTVSIPTDDTQEKASNNRGASTMENAAVADIEDLTDEPILPPSEHLPHFDMLARMLEASKSKSSYRMTVVAVDEGEQPKQSLSSEPSDSASGESKDSDMAQTRYLSLTTEAAPGTCHYRRSLSEEIDQSPEESGYSNVEYPITPPASLGLDHKDQQAYFKQVLKSNHPSVAGEQYQQIAGVSWEHTKHILQSRYLQPADLTESEFAALVCSQGNKTAEWLEKNATPILNRSVRKWMDSNQLLQEAGIQRPFEGDKFIRAFEYMSDEEQHFYVAEYQKVQLRAVAHLQQITLTQEDELAFTRLPVTARASFIKQYLGVAPESEPNIDPTMWTQVGERKEPEVSFKEPASSPTSSLASDDADSWVDEAFKKHESQSTNPASDILVEHLEDVQDYTSQLSAPQIHEDESPSSAKVSSDTEDLTMPCNCILRRSPAKSRLGLAHEYRALEIRMKVPTEVLANKNPEDINSTGKREPKDSEDLSIAARESSEWEPDKFSVVPHTAPSPEQDGNEQISPRNPHVLWKLDVSSPSKTFPTPRKASELPRPLTPIPDVTPYKPKSVHFDPSSASTASIDTVMLGLSRMRTTQPYHSWDDASDLNSDDPYSIFDAKFNAYTEHGSTAVDSQKSCDDSISGKRRFGMNLRRTFSMATLRLKSVVAVAEKEEDKPRSLRKKISRVWGSMSLRSRSGRAAFQITRR